MLDDPTYHPNSSAAKRNVRSARKGFFFEKRDDVRMETVSQSCSPPGLFKHG